MSLKPFTFYLDWVICGQFAGLCWAQAKGLYHQAGLDVTLLPWEDDGLSIVDKVLSASAKGHSCAGSSEDNLLCTSRVAGKPVKALATMLQHSPLVLITQSDSDIHSLADLPGHRLAMQPDGNRILEAVLALEGIDRNSIAVTESAYDLGRLTSRRFDAIQGYAMSEPIELAHLGCLTRVIPIRHTQLHPYSQVFFSTDEVIHQQPDALSKFLQASFTGWREAMTHQDEAAQVVVDMMGESGHWETEREMIRVMTPYVMGDVGLERFGYLDHQRWERNLGTYQRIGILPSPLRLDQIIHDHF
jgi:ABC-type nitrate/sulfonate/bicarbonate transport system substrate-binding protein